LAQYYFERRTIMLSKERKVTSPGQTKPPPKRVAFEKFPTLA